MAISDVKEFAHLTEADVEAIGHELDAIRADVEERRGQYDADYIRTMITWQRRLNVAARVTLFGSRIPPLWLAGTAMLSVAKILENMEIGHNVMHGQWDWMNDPEIHSSTWEWDNVCPAEQWRHSHNYLHHTYTNVIGKDKDVGYEILRVRADQPWHPAYLGQPFWNVLLMLLFEHGVSLHDLDVDGLLKMQLEDPEEFRRKLLDVGRKHARQMRKDFLLFPLLTGPAAVSTLTANATANVVRNIWSYAIIFCGHFPDGAEVFTEEELEGETRGEWYLRQLLGSANFTGNRLMHVMSGSLGYQIEHHLFPDLPSNRYPEIAVKVRALCEKYDLPYTTGPFPRQFWQATRSIWRLSLPARGIRESEHRRERRGLRRRPAAARAA
ncbi:fatty acid desaturase family protein [Pseudonocardia alni]|uniref:Linoleoyl-CoA desaturase n=1 Tax=Pseudonocardia alni TaxID=33907 RepID=A0A852W6B8_PSEA5|nr:MULTISPECIES: fatty acid desaturase [Pseudonocardia]MYW75519.1 acyl-CoA desaturase [Pseudonocardia sp. SID8383]OJG04824.1 Stearoyl-CoA 9-desaturase [Pseudonocardia autotrophica]MCO7194624.1 fatty acid desaturase [Pseudonocardia sp. McavD-2-B]NYG04429.1 linoleoyl-CoA desaturase [Pseudonocardia antarctica]PKB30070.1 linoleoyl-CoA desaturase [Pseudonocardia alni]